MKSEPSQPAYLGVTELCNFDHLAVRNSADARIRGAGTPRDAALRVFSCVRDAIPFDATLDIWQNASETLDKRVNDYGNKVNQKQER